MREIIRKPIVAYLIALLFLSAIFFLIPINLFDGEIVFRYNGVEFTERAKLSLSYFIGIGASAEETKDVVSFHLIGQGYLMVFLILGALPGLIAYRVHVANQLEQKK
jgi:Zn-dependent protease